MKNRMLIVLAGILIQIILINDSAVGKNGDSIQNKFAASPPLEVNYYLVDVSVQTTSDWAELIIDGLDYLTWKQVSALKLTDQCFWDGSHIYLNRPRVENMPKMALKLAYAISADKVHSPFSITFQRGDIGKTRLNITVTSAQGNYGPIIYVHDEVVPNSGGLNTVVAKFNLNDWVDTYPIKGRVRRISVPKKAFAFFYPWYTMESWDSDVLKDEPARRYSSADSRVVSRQIQQAKKAGIDGFISSWWGPGDYTDRNLRLLLRKARIENFKVFIYFETIGETGPLDGATIERSIEYVIDNYKDKESYLKYKNKPVIALWMSDTVPLKIWERVFTNLRSKGKDAFYVGFGLQSSLEVFDALHIYGIQEHDKTRDLFLWHSQHAKLYPLLQASTPRRLWIATAQPGYDDTLLPGRDGFVREREEGQYYRSSWNSAVASDPDWIFITTWNEYWENTHIEPSKNYGRQYLGITGRKIAEWKASVSSPLR